MPKQSKPVRICPVCSAADNILGNERLWPPCWRCPFCGHTLVIRADVPYLAPELDGEDVGFDPTAFATLARIEGGHFWFRAVLRVEHLSRRAGLRSPIGGSRVIVARKRA